MSWKDIETEWAAMTRRVRSDLPQGETDAVISRTPVPAGLQSEDTDQRTSPQLDRPTA